MREKIGAHGPQIEQPRASVIARLLDLGLSVLVIQLFFVYRRSFVITPNRSLLGL